MSSRPARIVVRRAQPSDLDAVAMMRSALIEDSRANLAYRRLRRDYAAAARPLFAAQLGDPRCLTLVATVGDEPVGLLRCMLSAPNPLHEPARHAYVVSVYVVPQARRRGVLKALVRAADIWCASYDIDEMRLHVGVENKVGKAAWKALGFEAAEILCVRRIPKRRKKTN